jgi:hypothetical protein
LDFRFWDIVLPLRSRPWQDWTRTRSNLFARRSTPEQIARESFCCFHRLDRVACGGPPQSSAFSRNIRWRTSMFLPSGNRCFRRIGCRRQHWSCADFQIVGSGSFGIRSILSPGGWPPTRDHRSQRRNVASATASCGTSSRSTRAVIDGSGHYRLRDSSMVLFMISKRKSIPRLGL